MKGRGGDAHVFHTSARTHARDMYKGAAPSLRKHGGRRAKKYRRAKLSIALHCIGPAGGNLLVNPGREKGKGALFTLLRNLFLFFSLLICSSGFQSLMSSPAVTSYSSISLVLKCTDELSAGVPQQSENKCILRIYIFYDSSMKKKSFFVKHVTMRRLVTRDSLSLSLSIAPTCFVYVSVSVSVSCRRRRRRRRSRSFGNLGQLFLELRQRDPRAAPLRRLLLPIPR